MFKDESKKRIYGYKLCDDITITSPQKVNGILLKKEKYYEVQNRIEKLESYIRSSENPFGILEMIMYDPKDLSKEDIFSRRKPYTSDELFAMRVPQLNDICETWDIDCIRKSKNKVVEELLNKFRIEKESKVYYYSEPEIQDRVIEVDVGNNDINSETIIENTFYDEIVECNHSRVGLDFVVTEPEEAIENENKEHGLLPETPFFVKEELEKISIDETIIENNISEEEKEAIINKWGTGESFFGRFKKNKDKNSNKGFKIGL